MKRQLGLVERKSMIMFTTKLNNVHYLNGSLKTHYKYVIEEQIHKLLKRIDHGKLSNVENKISDLNRQVERLLTIEKQSLDWDDVLNSCKKQYGIDFMNKVSDLIDENKIYEVNQMLKLLLI